MPSKTPAAGQKMRDAESRRTQEGHIAVKTGKTFVQPTRGTCRQVKSRAGDLRNMFARSAQR
jgi:hypothetical protein